MTGGAHSLRTRLLLTLVAAIALAVLAQAALAWRAALAEADALFDHQMQQTAQALRPGLPAFGLREYSDPLVPGQESSEFVVQVWTADGLRIFESNVGLGLPQRAVLGFSTVEAGGTTYRVLSVATPLRSAPLDWLTSNVQASVLKHSSSHVTWCSTGR